MSLRIESCTIDAFGPLEDLSLDDLDHSVVVLQGRNEAGKTAFFHFLQTMFYGIYPTDATKHPYAPRDGTPLKGRLDIRLREGTRYTVTRRLRSTPLGRLYDESDDSTRLRNRTLPAVQHVSRSVYESVYALQLEDLIQLEGQAWDEIQDRLLGTLSVDHIRPARVVVDELENEATDLWRTDNRGKPEAKQLQQRRRELREEARKARERDDRVRRLQDEISEHTQQIEALTDEQVELQAEQRRAERLVPVRQLLKQIEELEKRAGDLSRYDDLPEEPREWIEDLDNRIADLEAQRNDKRGILRRLKRALEAWSEEDEHVLTRADEIQAWVRRLERHQKQRVDLEADRREASEAQRRLEEAAGILSEPWDDTWSAPLRQLSLADLRERIKMYERAERRYTETRARAETIGLHAQARKSLVPWISIAVLGAAGAVLGLFVSLPVDGVPMAGGAVVLFGLLQALAAWRHNRQLDTQEEQLDLEGLRQEVEQRAAQVELLVDELPLPPERLEHPEADLVTDLQDLKEALLERDAKVRGVREQEQEIEEAEEALRDLARDCGLSDETIEQSVSEVVTALERRLDTAESRYEEAKEAEEEVPALEPEVESLADRLSELQERRDSAEQRLKELGDGDLDAGFEELAERRRAARRAEMTRDQLQSEYPDWESHRDEIENLEEEGEWSYTDEERARIDQRLEAIDEEIREVEKERTAKEKDVEHLLEQRTVGDIESELAHVERRLEEVRTERDRRMLLAGLIQKADADFRRKHQPDVIQRASNYLSTVTRGRYERLSLDEYEDQLVVHQAGTGGAQPVRPPLSQGTLDQIYLSLRLAIVDHLDADRERLPIFLDEVFVNWDRGRRYAAFDILADMAEERQLFLFTCHPYFAREVVHHLDAKRLDLTALQIENGEGVEARQEVVAEPNGEAA